MSASGNFVETAGRFVQRADIVPRERVEPWLAGEDVALAEPYPPESMRVRPVSRYVNRAAHDDARCIEPVVLE